MKAIRRYGYVRDYKDVRDSLFKSIRKSSVVIPDKVDLLKQQSPVLDQGNLGSCVAQALVSALGFLLLQKATAEHVLRQVKGEHYYELSPLFTYYCARKLDGSVKMDNGTQIRSGILSLANTGACREDLWPYIISKFARKPTKKCFTEAKAHKITSYYRLNGIDEMMECLAEGFPFVAGITVYDSFESGETSKTGIVQMPTINEKMLGGHALLFTGYDKNTRMFNFKNSWDGWGLNKAGYGLAPFEYMKDLASDAWVVKL